MRELLVVHWWCIGCWSGRRLGRRARRVADGALVGHDLAAVVEASRPLAAELATRAGLGGLSRLAAPAG